MNGSIPGSGSSGSSTQITGGEVAQRALNSRIQNLAWTGKLYPLQRIQNGAGLSTELYPWTPRCVSS